VGIEFWCNSKKETIMTQSGYLPGIYLQELKKFTSDFSSSVACYRGFPYLNIQIINRNRPYRKTSLIILIS